MYCTKCGKQMEDGSQFCIYCGHKLESAESDAPAAKAAPTQQPKAQPAKSPTRPKRKKGSFRSSISFWLKLSRWRLWLSYAMYYSSAPLPG